MADIVLLKNKLQGLSDKIKTKDALGKDYKKIVSDSLARINAKITKILADHNKQVQDITRDSAKNLDKTRAELLAQQARLKQASDAELAGARRNQGDLQKNLAATSQQVDNLRKELAKPNPDIPKLQDDIDLLGKKLENATNASAAANGRIVELTARLAAYDDIQAKMDELVKNLRIKIDDILAQVEDMSINKGDVDELTQLLRDTENLFPKDDGAPPSGDDGDGDDGLLSGLFGSSSNDVTPNNKRAGGFEPGGLRGYIQPSSNADSGDESGRVASRPVNLGPGGLPIRTAREPNVFPNPENISEYKGPVKLPSNKNMAGGKTKRRRNKRTMHRGGYVEEKKSATRNRRNRPRTSSRRRRSSSSSSASSNSRQKTMKGRNM